MNGSSRAKFRRLEAAHRVWEVTLIGKPIIPQGLQQPTQILRRELTIPKNLRQQTWTQSLAGVNWHDGSPPVRMTEIEVATLGPDRRESGSLQGSHKFLPGDP
jgi:hypothetical protein